MNVGMQRRIGTLPKTPDMLGNQNAVYGNTHRGYSGRTPTPTQKGFFGLGAVSNADGDGRIHIYGNDGVANLPGSGIYGVGSGPVFDNRPNNFHTQGLFGGLGNLSGNQLSLLGLVLIGAVIWKLK